MELNPKRYTVLAFLVTLSAITFLDRLAIAVAGPRIQTELNIPPEKWGWVLGAFALAYGIFEMPSGAAGDRYGQRGVLTRIVIWWSLFTALTAAATSYIHLLVTQFLFGAGEAGAYPNASGVIAAVFPKSERARAQGAVWAASRIGGALSPLLVVPLLHSIGWRPMFLALSVLGLAWSVLWRTAPVAQAGVPSGSPAHQPSRDSDSASTSRNLSALCASAVHSPSQPLRQLLASPQTYLLLATYSCYAWGSWFYFSWFPTYLVRGAHLTESEMGLYSALPFILGCCGNLAGGVLSDRLAACYSLKIARCGQAAASLALASLLILGLAYATRKAVSIALSSLGFGVLDLMLPATWSLCLDLGRSHAGLLSGAMNTAGLAGGFLCTVLFGYLVRATGGYRAPLTVIAAMVMLSAVLYTRIDPTRPIFEEAQ